MRAGKIMAAIVAAGSVTGALSGVASAQSSVSSSFCTSFSGSSLPSGWNWKLPNSQYYSFTEHPGWVTLDATESGLWGQWGTPENLLMHPVNSSKNFTVTVKMDYFNAAANQGPAANNVNFGNWVGPSHSSKVQPPAGGWNYPSYAGTPPFQQGTLILYQNRYHYLRVSRTPSNNAFQIYESNSSSTSGSNGMTNASYQTDPRAESAKYPVVYLRITKQGSTYTGYYSFSGKTWHQIYQISDPTLQPTYVGIQAHDTGAMKGSFDYTKYPFPVGFADLQYTEQGTSPAACTGSLTPGSTGSSSAGSSSAGQTGVLDTGMKAKITGMVNLAKGLAAEAFAKGQQAGMAEARTEVAKAMLAKGLAASLVSEVTKIPVHEVAAILKGLQK